MKELYKFHHIGLACKSLETEITAHELLNYVQETQVFEDPYQQIRGIFMTNSAFRIELLEPLSQSSPLNNYIKKGIQMYHQCFETKDLEKAIKVLCHEGAILVVEPIEAVAFNKKRIAFLYLKTKMLVELIEKTN